MDLSDDGAAFIARWEGGRDADGRWCWYQDVKGVWTIGIGHVWHPDADTEFADRCLSDDEAWALFRRDAARYIEAVNRYVTVRLDQLSFDALVSFAFNWGIGTTAGFPKTSVLAAVNRGDHQAVPIGLLRYDKGIAGVRNRRVAEGELYLRGVAAQEGRALRIVSREEWGARDWSGTPAAYPMSELWLHHSVTTATDDPAADARQIEGIGGGAPAYTFLAHPSGVVLEGRPIAYVGAHTYGRNGISLAVCLIGNYEGDEPTEAQIEAVRQLRDQLVRDGHLTPGTYPTGGHRDAPGNQTACPGRNAHARLDEFRAPSTGGTTTQEDDMPLQGEDRDKLYYAADLLHDVQRELLEPLGKGNYYDGIKRLLRIFEGVGTGGGGGGQEVGPDELADAIADKLAERLKA